MRKICLYTFFLTLLFAFYTNASAQDSTMLRKNPPKERFVDRMFFGGNIGLQFGTVTFVDVSPLVGYRITDKISAGIGVTYQYYHYKDNTYDFETNVYGGRVFGRYFFTDYLFAHAEYEYLNLEAFDFFPRRRVDVGSFLAGGGYFQRFGNGNSGIILMLLYNFTESVYTPYTNPIIRIGVHIGL
ncbi:MAG: outer membrane protein [Bacteroidota bacterium]